MKRFWDGILEYLEGLSQAFFLEEPLFGFCLLGLVFAFDRWLFLGAFAGSLVGHLHGIRFSVPFVLRKTGLLTLNGFFLGLALTHTYPPSVPFAVIAFLSALALPWVVQAIYELTQHWRLSPSLLPYLILTWGAHLCLGKTLVEREPELNLGLSAFTGMGRLLFVPHPIFGALLFGLILLFSIRRGVAFLLGTLAAVATGALLAPGALGWMNGQWTASAGILALGLASFPEKFTVGRIALFSALTAMFSVALQPLLGRIPLPLLTLPYVLTFWLAQLSRVPDLAMSWGRMARVNSLSKPKS